MIRVGSTFEIPLGPENRQAVYDHTYSGNIAIGSIMFGHPEAKEVDPLPVTNAQTLWLAEFVIGRAQEGNTTKFDTRALVCEGTAFEPRPAVEDQLSSVQKKIMPFILGGLVERSGSRTNRTLKVVPGFSAQLLYGPKRDLFAFRVTDSFDQDLLAYFIKSEELVTVKP